MFFCMKGVVGAHADRGGGPSQVLRGGCDSRSLHQWAVS